MKTHFSNFCGSPLSRLLLVTRDTEFWREGEKVKEMCYCFAASVITPTTIGLRSSATCPLLTRQTHSVTKNCEFEPICNVSRGRREVSRVAGTTAAGVATALAAIIICLPPAVASVESGAKIFEDSCVACHAGGGNVIGFARGKNLKLSALERYGYNSKESIASIIREGKGVMPAYKSDKLSDEQVDAVSEFVLSAAQRDWK